MPSSRQPLSITRFVINDATNNSATRLASDYKEEMSNFHCLTSTSGYRMMMAYRKASPVYAVQAAAATNQTKAGILNGLQETSSSRGLVPKVGERFDQLQTLGLSEKQIASSPFLLSRLVETTAKDALVAYMTKATRANFLLTYEQEKGLVMRRNLNVSDVNAGNFRVPLNSIPGHPWEYAIEKSTGMVYAI